MQVVAKIQARILLVRDPTSSWLLSLTKVSCKTGSARYVRESRSSKSEYCAGGDAAQRVYKGETGALSTLTEGGFGRHTAQVLVICTATSAREAHKDAPRISVCRISG